VGHTLHKAADAQLLHEPAHVAAPVDHPAFDVEHRKTTRETAVENAQDVVLRTGEPVGTQLAGDVTIEPTGGKHDVEQSPLARLHGLGTFEFYFQFHDANLNVLTLNEKKPNLFIAGSGSGALSQDGFVFTFARSDHF
jgi:hypothetical protein